MHRALKVNDIISLICEELDSIDPDDSSIAFVDLPSLSALAKTCTGFYEPAMRILCKELVDIYPVFHVFTVNTPGAWNSPSSTELSPRFISFTRRVQHITLNLDLSPPTYAATQLSQFETLKFLNHKTRSVYLLPRLQSLSLTGWKTTKTLPTEDIFPSLSTLIAPSLLNLVVHNQMFNLSILSLCALHNIRLKSCTAHLSLEWLETSGFLEVISGCEVINLGLTLQRGLLHRLAAFPNIQEFTGTSDTFTGPLPQGVFSKLRKFHYLAPEPSSFLHFLQQISDASSLSDISFVTLEKVARLEDGKGVTETLFQCPRLRPEIITSFHVALYAPPDMRMMSKIPSDTPWMSLFAQCISMKWVMIEFGRPLVITDAEFEQLVCNWHHLEIIEIESCRGNFGEPIQPLFSFGKINALVKHCPYLNILGGFIDMTGLTDNTLEKITNHNKHIDSLYVNTCSIVSDAEIVARHLYAWFPTLLSAQPTTDALCPCQLGPGTSEEMLEVEILQVWDRINTVLQGFPDSEDAGGVTGDSDDGV